MTELSWAKERSNAIIFNKKKTDIFLGYRNYACKNVLKIGDPSRVIKTKQKFEN
jgi:hypothetical protein